MVQKRRQRKSHLAAAINQSSPGVKLFWQIVIGIALLFALIMVFAH